MKEGYRSGLEHNVAIQLTDAGVEVNYEDPDSRIGYVQPESMHTYTPDFVLPNGIIIETKGRLTLDDRKKHLWVKDQHPEKDIRFVFCNPNQKIRKGSLTRYADWCMKNGFRYAKRVIPQEWIDE